MATSSFVDDGRPAGGTARQSGTKTPRKVQWASDERRVESDPGRSTHALDEHGLDPDAFENLTIALEQHRSYSAPSAVPQVGGESSLTASVSTSPDIVSPTREVPGEHLIEPGEKVGLPLPDHDAADFENYAHGAAARVVRAHTKRRRGFALFSKGEKEKNSSRHPRRRKSEVEGGDVSDVEKEADSGISTPAFKGGGVLSALLTLYDNQSLASGASTPARPSFDDPLRPERQWSSGIRPPPPVRRRSADRQERSRPRMNVGEEAPEVRVEMISSPTSPAFPPFAHTKTSPTSPTSPMSPPLSASESAAGDRTQKTDSPSALFLKAIAPPSHKKGGTGALGALIASTGNISGAAAPAPSTLAPNIKRPGYHLSRYSLESGVSDAKQPPKLRRAASAHFEDRQPSDASTPHTGSSDGHEPAHKKRWSGVLKDLPHAYSYAYNGWKTPVKSGSATPTTDGGDEWLDEKALMREEKRREQKRKRKKAEIYITRHVAQIIQRQEFIMKFARAMMMLGGPSHRLQAQIQSTARVLDIELSCMYLPDLMLISFEDSATGTSNVKFIRQGSALDLGKLHEAYILYWNVIHDEISVSEASAELDKLMRRRPLYSKWQIILIGGMCSASICSVSFNGSFIDSMVAIPLGSLLVAVQLLSVRNELYSNVFEITIATLLSFISAALASTKRFCYPAVASSSVVLILPGYIVLCASLELSSRNIVSGAVRLCFAMMYSLFLGFGLAIGGEIYQKMTSQAVFGSEDYTCSGSHDPSGPWWQRTPSLYWAFLTVPSYSLFLSLRNQAPWNRKELPLLVVVSCIGWVTNHFAGKKFPNQSDVSSAVGAFAVGMVSNVYGRFFSGNAFIVMITGILFQLPSGLGNGGLLTFASQQNSGSSTSYLSGFETALQLISVSIGLTVGLGISIVLVHPIQSRRRAGGVFSL